MRLFVSKHMHKNILTSKNAYLFILNAIVLVYLCLKYGLVLILNYKVHAKQ